MNYNSGNRFAYVWGLLGILIFCGVLVSGCAKALLESNAPTQVKLRILSSNPEKYSISVAEETIYPVLPDGRIVIHIPLLPSGCATYLLGVKVSDGASSYDVAAIQLKKDGQTIRKISLNNLAELPVDEQGYRLLKVE
jgi:hypothetical protein